jgi:hypothetical protein
VKQISSHFTTTSHEKEESLSPLRLFCPRVSAPEDEEARIIISLLLLLKQSKHAKNDQK